MPPGDLAAKPSEPGLNAAIAAAQADMERLIQLGGLQSDPLRHPIRALSVHLDVLTRLGERDERVIARIEQLLEEAKTQAAGEIARRALAELPRHAGQLVKTEHHKLVWRTAGLLLLMFIAGGTTLAAWQWLYGKPLLVSCDPRRAPDDQCYYQKKGGG
jgi:hypothetical protein